MRLTCAFARPSLTASGLLAVVLLAGGCANNTPSAGGGSSGAPPSGPTIAIGEYASMTGAQSTFGTSSDSGVKLAVKEINGRGGIDKHQLTVSLQDDASKPADALNVTEKILTEDKPTAVIGEVASGLTQQAAPACNAAKVPMISPSATNPKVTTVGPYIFRVCFIDPFQGQSAARFAFQNLHAHRAAVLNATDVQYSVGLTKFFTESFRKLGGTVVLESDYSKNDIDFKAQLTRIKESAPDVLYVPGYYDKVGPIAVQARQIGLKIPLLGGDGWDSPQLVQEAGGPGGALEGCYFTNHQSMDNPDPRVQTFVKAYQAAYQNRPDSLAALGYDAVGVLADALGRAGKPADGDYSSEAYRVKLRDAIAATKGYKGVTGTITIGPDRNAVKPLVVLQIKGDKFAFVTSVKPG